MNKSRQNPVNVFAAHAALILYTVIALFPVVVILINSFKTRRAIFSDPLGLPFGDAFSLVGYQTVMKQGDFFQYFQNSMIVTVGSLFFILLFGAMAAFALSEYRFKGNGLLGLYLALGIMIPIRIGTVAILDLMVQAGLVNTLLSLILVYTAQGLPLAIFILSEFMRQVSDDLKNAGRIDGLSEYTIFFKLVLPLVRPSMATVAVFNMIPIWNDLWFPLILVYTAQGLPLAVFILSEFMKSVSDDLKNAGRIDGLSEYRIFFSLVLPLVRPAMATVAVFTMIPIWNDLWFPLILAPAEDTKTVTLGAQVFIGQFVTDWNAVLAALSLAIVPVLILYLIFSRQLIRGITAGAVK